MALTTYSYVAIKTATFSSICNSALVSSNIHTLRQAGLQKTTHCKDFAQFNEVHFPPY
jgi:hypothetical protein